MADSEIREEVARVIAEHASDWDPEYGGGGGEDPVQTDYALADAVLALVRDAGLLQPLPAGMTSEKLFEAAYWTGWQPTLKHRIDAAEESRQRLRAWATELDSRAVRVPVEPKEREE